MFDLELLESVLEIDESALLDHLEAAVAASLLAESSERVGQFRFAHALINQTLYEGLGATRRARMHQRVAQALEQLYGAGPGRAPRRARAALAAGRGLRRQGQGCRLRAAEPGSARSRASPPPRR